MVNTEMPDSSCSSLTTRRKLGHHAERSEAEGPMYEMSRPPCEGNEKSDQPQHPLGSLRSHGAE